MEHPEPDTRKPYKGLYTRIPLILRYLIALVLIPLIASGLFIWLFPTKPAGFVVLVHAVIGIPLLFWLTVRLARMHGIKRDQYEEEGRFKDAVLRCIKESQLLHTREALYNLILETAVQAVPHTTSGSLLKVIYPESTPNSMPGSPGPGGFTPGIGSTTHFEAVYGHDISILKTLTLRLEETFVYMLTSGKCDRTVVVHNYQALNRKMLDSDRYERLEKGTSDISASSIMSAPVYVDNTLWGMLTIDSAANFDFTDRHIDQLNVFVGEIVKVIVLFREKEKNRWLMQHDPLTGMLNRTHFTERLKVDLEAASHGAVSGTLVSMDLDNFKSINDRLGHSAGDSALKHFATLFSGFLDQKDYLSRYGGDEFVAVLLNRSMEETEILLDRITSALAAQPLELEGQSVTIRFSHGLIAFNREVHNHQYLMHTSDAFMYECKRKHRQLRL